MENSVAVICDDITYAAPWSMSADTDEFGSSVVQDESYRHCVPGPESSFGRWLLEFADDKSGSSCPPPMC